MTEITSAPESSVKKKGLPTVAVIGIGCVGVLVLLSIIGGLAAKTLISKFGSTLLKQGIENKTGISVDSDGSDGTMSFTDKKTGERVSFGEEKLPDGFPKDFPIYSGAKPAGSISGNNTGDSAGYWVTLTTSDSSEKVTAFYNTALKTNGWNVNSTMSGSGANTWIVEKSGLSGSLTVNTEKDSNQTTIIIGLGSSPQTEPGVQTEE